ncbi:MAG: ParA family protein [Defluviitaleaceae bacterium]|nr:ParA family protein [Defluviitaleaceae bacterium]
MAKIITFFNHKGGVGKTTLSYNVAWGLSNAGKRVLMIDADSQCNLTEITVEDDYLYGETQQSLRGLEYNPDFFLQNNVYEYFSPYILPTLGTKHPQIKTFYKLENLKLLSGCVRFAELEEAIALSLSNVPAMAHIPKSTYEALQELNKDVDCIIVDLSPALSATNQLLLMLSDYFIIPVNPGIFSRQALVNLNEIFRIWNRKLSSFEIFSRKTKSLPKLLGIVCQNYRPFSREGEKNTTSAKRFEEKLAELNERAVELANDLNSFGMALTPTEFKRVFEGSAPYRIADIPDYNQLARVSENKKIPVAGIDNKILNAEQLNQEYYRQKLVDFGDECNKIVNGLAKIL